MSDQNYMYLNGDLYIYTRMSWVCIYRDLYQKTYILFINRRHTHQKRLSHLRYRDLYMHMHMHTQIQKKQVFSSKETYICISIDSHTYSSKETHICIFIKRHIYMHLNRLLIHPKRHIHQQRRKCASKSTCISPTHTHRHRYTRMRSHTHI